MDKESLNLLRTSYIDMKKASIWFQENINRIIVLLDQNHDNREIAPLVNEPSSWTGANWVWYLKENDKK